MSRQRSFERSLSQPQTISLLIESLLSHLEQSKDLRRAHLGGCSSARRALCVSPCQPTSPAGSVGIFANELAPRPKLHKRRSSSIIIPATNS
ncbi:MAG: hypothetical protein ACWA5W_10175 [Phycisphaerales bacterium]